MSKFIILIYFYSLTTLAYDFYQFDQDVKYQQGTIQIKDYQLATYHFKNKSDKLVISIHGYLDNCGYMHNIHQFLWEKDYSLFCIDLPGHGNSSGAKGEINSFKSYGEIIPAIPKHIFGKYSQIILLGHSTGNVAITMHLLAGKPHSFDKIIMLAPLIRSKFWSISKWGHTLLKYFTDSVPRTSKNKKHYQALLARTKLDPKYINFQSLKWFRQLILWNEELKENKERYQQKMTIFYGDRDEVVDTDYNIQFLSDHFPNSVAIKLKNATHHMDYNPVNEIFWEKLTKLLTAVRPK